MCQNFRNFETIFVSTHMGCVDTFGLSRHIWDVSTHLGCVDTFGLSRHIWAVSTHLGCLDTFGLSRHILAVSTHLGCLDTFGLSRHIWPVSTHLGCVGAFLEMPRGITSVARSSAAPRQSATATFKGARIEIAVLRNPTQRAFQTQSGKAEREPVELAKQIIFYYW